MRRFKQSLAAVLALTLVAGAAQAEVSGLKAGSPKLKSAGPLAFGPEGVLLVGDTKAAAVYAIDTRDTTGDASKAKINVDGLSAKIAAALGGSSAKINDLAVNPATGNVFVSVTAGGKPAIVKIASGGKISKVNLAKVRYSMATLPNAPEDKVTGRGRRRRNLRDSSITDIAFVEGQIIVSGTATVGGKSSSVVRSLAFPPSKADPGIKLQIYHGAHGRLEDSRAANTIIPFAIDGKMNILAAYTCTPLVKFPISSIVKDKEVRGTTVAELGNRNRPIDMITYKKDGKSYLLLTNSSRGVMKIGTDKLGVEKGITSRVGGGGTAGQGYETIESLKGATQLDKLNKTHAVVLIGGNLKTVALP